MTKIIRALMALASFALSSALFAGSADLQVSTGSIDISAAGTQDGDVTIVNLDTNQIVATVTVFKMGWGYGSDYYFYGDTYLSGVTITSNYNTYGSVSGLPAGNYRVIASSWQMYDFSSYGGGSYAEIALWGYYGAWMDFYFYAY